MSKHLKNWILIGGLSLAAILPMPISSWAASKKINNINLEINAQIEPDTDYGDEVIQIDTSGSKYYVSGYQILNEDNYWKPDSVPQLEITLVAEDDYYFPSVNKDSLRLKGSGAQFVSATRGDGNETLMVRVKLDNLNRTMKDIEKVTLSLSGNAFWPEQYNAGSYEVRVYRDGRQVGTPLTSLTNSCNCREKMTRSGVYYVKVRAVNKYDSTIKGNWASAESIYVNDEIASFFKGNPGVSADGNITSGSWRQLGDARWIYDLGDGALAKDGWKLIDGEWYYFNEQGIMQTGWISWNGKYYYCADNGHMLTDCMTPDQYWVGADGAWIQQEPSND